MRTPPLSPAFASLNLPLPRPPAWICDLTAQTEPPSFFAASTASVTEKAGSPCATGTPNFARTCFAWYSWMFIRRAPPRGLCYLPNCGAILLQASISVRTAVTDLSNISRSAPVNSSSITRSTPLAPITTGTPTYMSFTPYSPLR